MQRNRNERGSVLVFVTLMMVLLFVMVGMGLDTGQLTYVRSQGQPAVDAAALAAVNALPTLDMNKVNQRAAELNFNGSMGNNYLNSSKNTIGANNVTLITYNQASGTIGKAASISSANGVRVALESTNPYDGAATATPMKSPVFLTPLLNLLGFSTKGTQNVSVSAVAVLTAIPGMPVAMAGCDISGGGCTPDCRPPSALCENAADSTAGTESNPWRNCRLLQVDSSNNGKGQGTDNGKYQDSGWTTYGVPSANAPSIKALVRNNSTCANIPPINIGQGCIYLNNGQITPVLTEFEDVYGANPGGFVGPATANNTPVIPPEDWGVIPVVDKSIGNFNGCEPVRSWAKFGIRGVITQGSEKWLLGDLVCNWSLDRVGGTGCYTTQLVRDKMSGM
jgi:Flp pilus assembly protein TadG